MPIGCLSGVPHVAARLMARGPGEVLDMGIGMGFYGTVVRQWLDLGAQPWKTRLVGVEGWAEYRNPLWDLYDEVHVARIEDCLERSHETFDAIRLMDVLEHFDHDAGQRVIRQAIELLSPAGLFFVATPAVWMDQDAAHGNELERHRALWTAVELSSLGFAIISDGTPDEFGNQMLLACFTGE